MSISYSPTLTALRVEIKPSNYFRALLVGIAAAALGAIFYAELLGPLRVLLATLTLLYTGYCWRVQTRQRGILQWRSVWFWRGADGIERALRLRHSTVWPGLIVLVFSGITPRDAGRAQNFVLTLFADSFENDCARRLRVHLNHFPVFDTGDPSVVSDTGAD